MTPSLTVGLLPRFRASLSAEKDVRAPGYRIPTNPCTDWINFSES